MVGGGAAVGIGPDGSVSICARQGRPVWLKNVVVDYTENAVLEGGFAWLFDARSVADVILLLTKTEGDDTRAVRNDLQDEQTESVHRAPYELVFGSHCNSRILIRKFGVVRACERVSIVPESSWAFCSYWIAIVNGTIAMGEGSQVGENELLRWFDPEFVPCGALGVSCWDEPVVLRRIRIVPLDYGLVSCKPLRPICESSGSISKLSGCFNYFRRNEQLLDMRICIQNHRYVQESERNRLRVHAVYLCAYSSCMQSLIERRNDEYILNVSLSENAVSISRRILHVVNFVYGLMCSFDNEAELVEFVETLELLKLNRITDLFKQCMDEKIRNIRWFGTTQISLSSLFGSEFQLDSFLSDWFLCALDSKILVDVQLLPDGCGLYGSVQDCKEIDIGSVNESNSIQAHKVVLAARNAYFRTLFTSEMQEAQRSCIPLSAVQHQSIQKLLVCIYAGDYDDARRFTEQSALWKSSDGDNCSKDIEYLLELLHLGELVGVGYLSYFATQNLSQLISIDTAVLLACEALHFNRYTLFESAVQFICRYPNECFSTKVFDGLDAFEVGMDTEVFMSVLSRDELLVDDEHDVFDFILRWISSRCLHFSKILSDSDIDVLSNSEIHDHEVFIEQITSSDDDTTFNEERNGLIPDSSVNSLSHSDRFEKSDHPAHSGVRESFESFLHDIRVIVACHRFHYLAEKKLKSRVKLFLKHSFPWNAHFQNLFVVVLEHLQKWMAGEFAMNRMKREPNGEDSKAAFHNSSSSIPILPFAWIPQTFCISTCSSLRGNDGETQWMDDDRASVLETLRQLGMRARFGARQGEIGLPLVPLHIAELGLLDYLAQQCAAVRGSWRNPIRCGAVKVDTSSPRVTVCTEKLVPQLGAHSRGHAVLIPDESGFAWVCLDVGDSARLACHYYAVVHDTSSEEYLRHWILEASSDGECWELLSERTNDNSISCPSQKGVWPIRMSSSALFFRYFRLSSKQYGERLRLGGIELYGSLRIGFSKHAHKPKTQIKCMSTKPTAFKSSFSVEQR